jgi:hypothetical protein
MMQVGFYFKGMALAAIRDKLEEAIVVIGERI